MMNLRLARKVVQRWTSQGNQIFLEENRLGPDLGFITLVPQLGGNQGGEGARWEEVQRRMLTRMWECGVELLIVYRQV